MVQGAGRGVLCREPRLPGGAEGARDVLAQAES